MKNPIIDLAEKAVATYVQALVAALVATTFFEDIFFDPGTAIGFGTAAAVATIPAGLTVIANGITAAAIPVTLPTHVQSLLRIARSGAAGFLGYLLALPAFELNASVANAAWAAGALALAAAIKAEIGAHVGNRASVAWLPASVDPVSA